MQKNGGIIIHLYYMDNNIDNNVNKSVNFINKVYDKLTYLDLYGSSIIGFVLITLFVFFIYTYCSIMQTKTAISDDWINQRCKPQIIPFAGFINKPEGVSSFQYTGDNFQYCVQNILVNITGYMVQPFNYMINSLNNIFKELLEGVNKLRHVSAIMRNNIRVFAENILHRALNVVVPVQSIFIALIDTLNKTQGILTAGLFTMLGAYLTLKSLMGAMLELMIKLLVVLGVIVVGLWIMPFTWPAAASMTAVFTSIAIPLSIIIAFMTEVLHIKASKIPKLRCFDKHTLIKMNDGTFKEIQYINVGDLLDSNVKVTAKFKVDSSELQMFNINNVVVSGCHKINVNNNFVSVKDYIGAQQIDYFEPYLYCLNTSSKEIVINGISFSDWDELDQMQANIITNSIKANDCNTDNKSRLENIHKYLDKGFEFNALIKLENGLNVKIGELQIGDKLETGGTVYGVVEILASDLINLGINMEFDKIYHVLTTKHFCMVNNLLEYDYNSNIDSILQINDNDYNIQV